MNGFAILKKEIDISPTRKGHKMIQAHFMPHELDLLDHLQGKSVRNSLGMRSYSDLWHNLLKHSHVKDMIKDHSRAEFAKGGHMSKISPYNGIHGDTEVASIPVKMAELFNEIIGGENRNYRDGHPQYYELSNKLQPLIEMFRNGLGHLSNFGRRIGNNIYSGVSNFGNFMTDKYRNARNYFSPQSELRQPLLDRSSPPPQTWEDSFRERGRNIGRSAGRIMGAPIGGGIGSLAGSHGGSWVGSKAPIPFGGTLGRLMGAGVGGVAGREIGRLAGGKGGEFFGGRLGGALGRGMDLGSSYIPGSIKRMPQNVAATAQSLNPWSHAANFLASIKPQPSRYESGYPDEFYHDLRKPLLDDVD